MSEVEAAHQIRIFLNGSTKYNHLPEHLFSFLLNQFSKVVLN